jgi:NAD(P) transhydrogenase
MGPFTGHKGQFYIDHKDEAVRGALVLDNGEMMWPAPPPKVGQYGQKRKDYAFRRQFIEKPSIIQCGSPY